MHPMACALTTQDSTGEGKHDEACIKFAAGYLDKPVNYWENVVWSDEVETELWVSSHTGRRMVLQVTPEIIFFRLKHYRIGGLTAYGSIRRHVI